MSVADVPDRKRQTRTTLIAAVLTVVLLGVPIIVTLILAVDTSSDTDAIREAGDQADRNFAVQSCSTEYSRTYAFWDAEADRLFALIVQDAFADERPSTLLLRRFQTAGENESEINRRGIGVVELARDEQADAERMAIKDEEEYRSPPPFACPPIPERLRVEPLDPTSDARPD